LEEAGSSQLGSPALVGFKSWKGIDSLASVLRGERRDPGLKRNPIKRELTVVIVPAAADDDN